MAEVSMKPQKLVVDMVISHVSKLTEIRSPVVFIHGIPWQVEASKCKDENSLSVYLECVKEDDSSNWTVPAYATIKLMPFSDDKTVLVQDVTPYVFRPSEPSFGFPSFIEWDELMANKNQYVKNDTIQLKIEITTEDPNHVDRSILKFETIDKSCDCGSYATFRLTVTNVDNLLAVSAPKFIVRGLRFGLTVYKHQTSGIGVMLDLSSSTEDVSCKMKMSVKLLSFKNDVDPIKNSVEKQVKEGEILNMKGIISWQELFKSKTGFVKKNSITLEVKIKAKEPDDAATDANPSTAAAAKRRRLECSICLEDMDDQDISTTTPCGHLFCTDCITKALKGRGVCPMCKAKVKNLQRVYLPALK